MKEHPAVAVQRLIDEVRRDPAVLDRRMIEVDTERLCEVFARLLTERDGLAAVAGEMKAFIEPMAFREGAVPGRLVCICHLTDGKRCDYCRVRALLARPLPAAVERVRKLTEAVREYHRVKVEADNTIDMHRRYVLIHYELPTAWERLCAALNNRDALPPTAGTGTEESDG